MQNGENIQEETVRDEFVPSSSYERVIYGIYRMPTVAEMLRVVSHVIGALAIYAYAWLLLMTLNDKGMIELMENDYLDRAVTIIKNRLEKKGE